MTYLSGKAGVHVLRGLRRHSSDEIVQGVVVVDFVRLELMLVQSKRPQLLTKQTHEAERISRNNLNSLTQLSNL